MATEFNRKNLSKLQSALNAWRDERKLSIASQRAGLIANILEEVTEYMRALTDDDKIDALCDICVFAINAIDIDLREAPAWLEDNEHKLTTWDKFKYPKKSHEWNCRNEMRVIVGTLSYMEFNELFDQDTDYMLGQLYGIIHSSFIMGFNMGYDMFACMQEVIKEISSRTGAYDESIGKWVKDTSPEAKAKWYKADFSKCRLEP